MDPPRPQACAPFTHLTLTGGAIGCGPPMALGAALALQAGLEGGGGRKCSNEGRNARGCEGRSGPFLQEMEAQGCGGGGGGTGVPRRRVINLQADGSAMYSLQV